jgi:phosphodiesterase/alkaline phosphatase D-like protein
VVVLFAGAVARKASYDWQYSTDEETWTSAETTFQATTTLLGLAAGTRYFFRFRARRPEGLRDWSRVLSRIVV